MYIYIAYLWYIITSERTPVWEIPTTADESEKYAILHIHYAS
jgi:hypothetical protein